MNEERPIKLTDMSGYNNWACPHCSEWFRSESGAWLHMGARHADDASKRALAWRAANDYCAIYDHDEAFRNHLYLSFCKQLGAIG